jgi:ABC-type Fe3+ transport system permease subunit
MAITLAQGLVLQFENSILFQHGHNTWLIIVFGHSLLSIPFATRALLDSYNRIDKTYLQVAETMGASRFTTFLKLELPLLKRGMIVGLSFAFAISVGEFAATLFLGETDYTTLSVAINKLINSSNLQLASSIASILIVFTLLAFYLIERFSESKKL